MCELVERDKRGCRREGRVHCVARMRDREEMK